MEVRKGIVATNPNTGAFQYYEGLDKWGMQNFIFSNEGRRDAVVESDFFPQELGEELIRGFFKYIHPQAPILDYSVVLHDWKEISKNPDNCVSSDGRRIIQMVLAIGACVLCSQKNEDSGFLEKWSKILSKRADAGVKYFEDPTVGGIQVLVLKTLYALQIMKANEAFMYVGHAARSVLALGLNRQQVVHADPQTTYHLKILFWSIYIYERMSALMTGRPSCLQENQIDITLPEDILTQLPSTEVTTDCAWIRAMAELSRIADKILTLICSTVTSSGDIEHVQHFMDECKAAMEAMKERLPASLHFFNPEMPIGTNSQEIQRSHLGFTYYLISMVLYRPSLVYSSLFESPSKAQESTAHALDILSSIDIAMQSARNLIQLAYTVYFHRFPDIKQDRIIVTYLVYACATLLYDVLVPGSDIGYARDAFGSVDDAIQCLEQVVNIGTTTGKNVSLEIMKVAKEAWTAAGYNLDSHVDFIEDFPWLVDDITDELPPADNDGFNSAFFALHESLDFMTVSPHFPDLPPVPSFEADAPLTLGEHISHRTKP
ncbi:hypothetical protein N7478_012275 [Penicillium angulare]|uniref:uncharacterized protein n=1 Tax=Penicillium angulare TaxID=116970 RepID=UPI00254180DD|nr:uncharacterized protein N7478_012275 [Penicillium angulare]KAJ5259294.1 hypothetical protein N7478_012275 [Penicillium angulare]